ncbi:hypothetical protein [uncultured Deefgea sp.]|uniref:hypothetical protein n=1 Tax=uncultured Deefgea sp. TaxID=1304914 RepID=UPI00260C0698|nr:hypothetical protein [uncultured Deefgea sp.]
MDIAFIDLMECTANLDSNITFKDLMEYFIALATLGTMIAAFQALKTWKEQLVANRSLDLHSRIINVISEWEIFTIELCVRNQKQRVLREWISQSIPFSERKLTNQEIINKNTLILKSLHTTIKYGTTSCENHDELLKELQEAIEIQNKIMRYVANSSLSTSENDFPLKDVREQMEAIAKASMYLIPKI